jgi:hypothetical protein
MVAAVIAPSAYHMLCLQHVQEGGGAYHQTMDDVLRELARAVESAFQVLARAARYTFELTTRTLIPYIKHCARAWHRRAHVDRLARKQHILTLAHVYDTA